MRVTRKTWESIYGKITDEEYIILFNKGEG